MPIEDYLYSGEEVAEAWEMWCGDTSWSRSIREWGELGGKVIWFCGYPRSKSAIPLCFTLITPDGNELKGNSRLRDIKAAVAASSREPGSVSDR